MTSACLPAGTEEEESEERDAEVAKLQEQDQGSVEAPNTHNSVQMISDCRQENDDTDPTAISADRCDAVSGLPYACCKLP